MDTRQISSILSFCPLTKQNFRGVFPVDLINQNNEPGLYVCNTDPSHMPGQHWIVISISKNYIGEYFDSFGFPPQKIEFLNFLNRNTQRWTYNKKVLQHPFSTVCGHYCVLYALNYSKGLSLEYFSTLFNKNLYENDIVVHEYVKSKFGVDVPLIDVDIIVNQLGY